MFCRQCGAEIDEMMHFAVIAATRENRLRHSQRYIMRSRKVIRFIQ